MIERAKRFPRQRVNMKAKSKFSRKNIVYQTTTMFIAGERESIINQNNLPGWTTQYI